MATRSGERQPNYGDLRERARRKEHLRDQNLKRLVETHRERHLHSFESTHHGERGAPPD